MSADGIGPICLASHGEGPEVDDVLLIIMMMIMKGNKI